MHSQFRTRVLIISFHIGMIVVTAKQNYDHISECIHYDSHTSDKDNVTFICNGVNDEHKVFGSDVIHCSNRRNNPRSWFRQIEFKGCHFSEMREEFFGKYQNLRTVIISDANYDIDGRIDEGDQNELRNEVLKRLRNSGLRSMLSQHIDLSTPNDINFGFTRDQRELNLSHVRLKEIPDNLLINTTDLIGADFSGNSIARISKRMFRTNIQLKSLDLSSNAISSIDGLSFSALSNLEKLNLSSNLLDVITDQNTLEFNTNLKSLDLSQNILSSLNNKTFYSLENLEILNVSHNHLGHIPDDLLTNATKLIYVDFSSNFIAYLSGMTFQSNIELRFLNLSLNKIPSLDGQVFSTLSNLETLDISFNPIGFIHIETFAHLLNLKYLSLRQTNLKEIQIGTFALVKNLESLDLRENHLQTFDFTRFIPGHRNLRSIRLARNRLNNLDHFRIAYLPELKLFDIQNNDFNCSFLRNFLESTNWLKNNIDIDTNSIDLKKPHIGGVNCNSSMNATNVDKIPTFVNSIETRTKTFLNSENNNQLELASIKVCIIIMCTVMLIFFISFIVFIVLSRKWIYQHVSSLMTKNSSNEKVVKYSNDEMLLE